MSCRKFDFKQGAVRLVIEDRTVVQVAGSRDNEGILGDLSAQYRRGREGGQAELVNRAGRAVRSVALWLDDAMGR